MASRNSICRIGFNMFGCMGNPCNCNNSSVTVGVPTGRSYLRTDRSDPRYRSLVRSLVMIDPNLPIGADASLLLFVMTVLGLWFIGSIVWDRVKFAIKNLKNLKKDV